MSNLICPHCKSAMTNNSSGTSAEFICSNISCGKIYSLNRYKTGQDESTDRILFDHHSIFLTCDPFDLLHGFKIFNAFLQHGLPVFFPAEHLRDINPQYWAEIMIDKIEKAISFVVVVNSKSFLQANILQFDIESFLDSVRLNRKQGKVILLIGDGINRDYLLPYQQHFEVIPLEFSEDSIRHAISVMSPPSR